MAERHRKDKADRHPTVGVLVRFPADMDARLREEAGARDVPVAWLVRRLVAEGLENLVPVQEFLTRPRGGS